MNLHTLIEELQNLIETGECSGEEEVLFAHQPSYPLQCYISGPVVLCPSDEEIEEVENHLADGQDHLTEEDVAELQSERDRLHSSRKPIVYLSEGGTPSDPYAPRAAWPD